MGDHSPSSTFFSRLFLIAPKSFPHLGVGRPKTRFRRFHHLGFLVFFLHLTFAAAFFYFLFPYTRRGADGPLLLHSQRPLVGQPRCSPLFACGWTNGRVRVRRRSVACLPAVRGLALALPCKRSARVLQGLFYFVLVCGCVLNFSTPCVCTYPS